MEKAGVAGVPLAGGLEEWAQPLMGNGRQGMDVAPEQLGEHKMWVLRVRLWGESRVNRCDGGWSASAVVLIQSLE